MPIPDYQTLMLFILQNVAREEVRLSDLVKYLVNELISPNSPSKNIGMAIANLPKSIVRYNRDRTAREILIIINQLEKVKPQTTVYPQALGTMNFANQKLKQLR